MQLCVRNERQLSSWKVALRRLVEGFPGCIHYSNRLIKMQIRTKNTLNASFSMASMTDVLFLLLIFLVIAARHTPTAIPVDLPVSSNEKTTSSEVHVTVTKQLHYYVEGQQLPFDQLSQRLKEQLEEKSSNLVVLHMDQTLSIAQMVAVSDVANKLGATVSIATTLKRT
jgi:biopolymer transport protein ExbD